MPPETSRRLAATVTAFALVLAACASPPPAPPPAPVPTQATTAVPEPAPAPAPQPAPVEVASPALLALAHADRIRGLPPADLAPEIARLAALADAEPDRLGAELPLVQVQLAMTLMQTRSALDALRAGQLLQRVLGQATPEARLLQPVARLLQAQVLEQKRLEDQLDRQAQQLRDAQRRADQLNDRLDALRAIERSRPRPQ